MPSCLGLEWTGRRTREGMALGMAWRAAGRPGSDSEPGCHRVPSIPPRPQSARSRVRWIVAGRSRAPHASPAEGEMNEGLPAAWPSSRAVERIQTTRRRSGPTSRRQSASRRGLWRTLAAALPGPAPVALPSHPSLPGRCLPVGNPSSPTTSPIPAEH